MEALGPDRDQIARQFSALFLHASEGGTVSLRAFYDDELARRCDEKPFRIVSVRLNGGGLDPVTDRAFGLAIEAAHATRPVVVAPPFATFNGRKADAKSQLEGFALSVELDANPTASLAKLRAVLGPPTLVVASGGEWTDSDGEVHAKLHAHWRLREPTQTPEEHQLLNRARALACDLVGADATSKNSVHPMRLAGTLHRKNPDHPKLATILEENPGSEISLEETLAELEGLEALREAAAGAEKTSVDGSNRSGGNQRDNDPTADDGLILAAAELIPNDGLDWHRWNRLGMACWRASSGSEVGRQAFHAISRKSAKYDAEETDTRYDHYGKFPPDRLTAATLVHEARKGDPGFLKKKPKPEPDHAAQAEPEPPDEEGFDPATDHDGRIVIKLGAAWINGTTRACAKVLEDELYLRGSLPAVLVRVGELGRGHEVEDDEPEAGVVLGQVRHAASSLIFMEPTPERLMYRIDQRVAFRRFDARSEEWVPASCPAGIAKRLIGAASDVGLRPCAGIITVPLFVKGKIIDEPGYYLGRGVFLDVPTDLPAITERPTKEDALRAFEVLLSPFRGYVSAARDEAEALRLRCAFGTAGLTAVLRPSLPTAPGILFDADVPGAGKGKAARALSVIATGRLPAIVTEGHAEEETEKRLASAILSGSAAILLDNLQRTLASSTLESGLTEGTATIRIFGRLVDVTVPCAALVVITANNASLRADMLRRTLPVRIIAGTDKPETRVFDFDPYEEASRLRPELVVAGLTIAKAWWLERDTDDGRRIRGTTLGSFERWADLVAGAVEWLTGMNPVKLIEARKAEDPARNAEWHVVSALRELFGEREWTAKEAVGEPAKTDPYGGVIREATGLDPDVWASVFPLKGPRPSAMQVGQWLNKRKDRVWGDWQLTNSLDRNGVARWRIVELRGLRGLAGVNSLPRGKSVGGDFSNPDARVEESRDDSLRMAGWRDPRRPPQPPRPHPFEAKNIANCTTCHRIRAVDKGGLCSDCKSDRWRDFNDAGPQRGGRS
jgi:putative DNA primase/helicase